MTLKSTLLPLLMCLFVLSSNAGSTITTVVTPTALCQGDSFTLAIATPDTFATGNVFYIQLSDSAGSFANPTIIDSLFTTVSDTANFATPVVSKNSSRYKIRIVSTSDSISVFNTTLTIHHTPVVTFQLPQPSYCTYVYDVALTGGSPTGGVYSGTNVTNNAFKAYTSGPGTFPITYTYTDSIGCSAQASANITIASCPAPSIGVVINPVGICAGTNIDVTVLTSDVLGSDNVFTVQLSDANGSFAHPTVLLTDTSATGGTVTIAAPVEAPGSNYEVRVLASDPSTISLPFNVVFRAQLAAPPVSLNATGNVSLCTKDSLKLVADSVHGVSYHWTFNGNPINVARYTYTAKDSGLYKLSITDTTVAGCSSGIDSVFIGIYPYPAKPVLTPRGVVNSCGNTPVALSTPTLTGITFQWTRFNANISGATNNTYSADSSGTYRVKAVSHGCSTKSDSVKVNILPNPHVTLNLVLDSFCVNSAPIALSGGMPAGTGGFYTSPYITGLAAFNPSVSGVGTFEVRYTYVDAIGCSGTDSASLQVFNCTTSGINELANTHDFEMFPNPASGKVTINTGINANCHLRMFNLLGQQINSQSFNQQLTLSVEGLTPGVYMVELTGVNDNWKSVKRLVIQ